MGGQIYLDGQKTGVVAYLHTLHRAYEQTLRENVGKTVGEHRVADVDFGMLGDGFEGGYTRVIALPYNRSILVRRSHHRANSGFRMQNWSDGSEICGHIRNDTRHPFGRQDRHITGETIVTIIACLIIMVVLTLFIKKTKAGQAMLAVSEDKEAAELMGVNVNRTISLTFAIGSGLAAIAGVLLCSAYPTLNPYTGSMPGIKAFVAAVFGGIGSIPGALVGGLLLGIIENLSKAYISSQMADAIVFSVLIIVLLVKPTGLMGRKMSEKV